jgi:hypothetical protein
VRGLKRAKEHGYSKPRMRERKLFNDEHLLKVLLFIYYMGKTCTYSQEYYSQTITGDFDCILHIIDNVTGTENILCFYPDSFRLICLI